MGSWGHGMRDSDGAMDAVDISREAIDTYLKAPGPVESFLKKWSAKAGEGPVGLLGLAEELLERGVDLRPAEALIHRSIQAELKPRVLADWDSPAHRRKALLAFRKRIARKPSPPKPRMARRAASGPILEKRPAREGRIAFRKQESWGFLDAKGNVAVPAMYDFAEDFTRGRALVGTALDADKIRHRFQSIDQTGRVIKTFDFNEVYAERRQGLRVAMMGRAPKTRYGFIDRSGEWAIPPKYSWALDFDGGKAQVAEAKGDDEEWAHYFIDKRGLRISPIFYEQVQWNAGLAPVKVGGKIGYINRELQWHIRPKFHFADLFIGGVALVRVGSGPRARYGMIDTRGRYVIKPEWEQLEPFDEGRARVEKKGRVGFIDIRGKLVVPLQFEEAEDFSQGRAAVKVGGRWGFIDKKGTTVIPPQYDSVTAFSAGSAEVILGKKKFFIGLDGHPLTKEEIARSYRPILYQNR